MCPSQPAGTRVRIRRVGSAHHPIPTARNIAAVGDAPYQKKEE